jgi:hypothetical protein
VAVEADVVAQKQVLPERGVQVQQRIWGLIDFPKHRADEHPHELSVVQNSPPQW